MKLNIVESVGVRGANEPADVIVVQSLLNRHMGPTSRHLKVDGLCGRQTDAAIEVFQRKLGFRDVDGRVDPGGQTFRALTDVLTLQTVVLDVATLMDEAEKWYDHVFATAPQPVLQFHDWDLTQTSVDGPQAFNSEPGKLCWGAKVATGFKQKVIVICKDLGLNPDYLMACMAFESAESFSASKTNAAGSGAVGLIQFMPRTATGLKTSTAQLAAMTPEGQLDYVQKYLEPYKGKMKTLEDLYMAILYPADIGQPSTAALFTSPSTVYTQNKGFDKNKDGKITIGEVSAALNAEYRKGLLAGNYG